MTSILYFIAAAVSEIAGCFSFWAWAREQRSPWWMLPGTVALILFAYLLTRVEIEFAGRAYAAYGGIYIVASLLWLWLVEGKAPEKSDILGVGLCILGISVMLLANSSKPQ